MNLNNWLQDALVQAGAKIVNDALSRANEQISDEMRKALEMMKPEHTAGTISRVIDSTAITIDDDVKALPAPEVK